MMSLALTWQSRSAVWQNKGEKDWSLVEGSLRHSCGRNRYLATFWTLEIDMYRDEIKS
jgi:hypothetical protein